MRRRHFTKLAEDMREGEINGGNKALGTSFKKPEDFLPRITDLICSKDENARIAGDQILGDLGRSNPASLATILPTLLPLLRKGGEFRFCDGRSTILKVIRDVAKHDALLLPPPVEVFDAIIASSNKPLSLLYAFTEFNETIDAVSNGMMAAVHDKKRKRKALTLLSEITETRTSPFKANIFEIMSEAEQSGNPEYLLICKIVRNYLDAGVSIPQHYAGLLRKGISGKSKKAQEEGKELAKRISPN